MTVPEGGFATEWTPTEPSKRQFAEGRGRLCARCLLCLLADVLAAILLCLHSSSRCLFAPFATTAFGACFLVYFSVFICLFSISASSPFLKGLRILSVKPNSVGLAIDGSSEKPLEAKTGISGNCSRNLTIVSFPPIPPGIVRSKRAPLIGLPCFLASAQSCKASSPFSAAGLSTFSSASTLVLSSLRFYVITLLTILMVFAVSLMK